MRDFAIDNETLSTHTDCALIAVGVQQFDLKTGKLGQTFYREIQIASAMRMGRVDGSTLIWWMNQSPEARMLFTRDPDETSKVAVATALDELNTFLRANAINKTGAVGMPTMWSDHPATDLAQLRWNYAHSAVALEPAWHYRNIRCMNTLADMADSLGNDITWRNTVTREGVHHNALDDATYIAKMAIAAYGKLSGKPIVLNNPKPPGKQASLLAEKNMYFLNPKTKSVHVVRKGEALPLDKTFKEVDEAAWRKWDAEQDL